MIIGSPRDESAAALTDRIAELRHAAEDAVTDGHLGYASRVSAELGDILAEVGDREGAESAYRQAVAFARVVEADLADLVLDAFESLIVFLSPSEESTALGAELATNLVEREDMYHPMRGAEAVKVWAYAELAFAEVEPDRMDRAISGVAEPAIQLLDSVCFHDDGQELQRRVAAALDAVGRGAEADQWRVLADAYEDWERFSDQRIPGHVHLWDVRFKTEEAAAQWQSAWGASQWREAQAALRPE